MCAADAVPARGLRQLRCDQPWRALQVEGPLDFNLVGVLASLLQPLRAARVPVFVLSTFDTDYVLVRSRHVDRAVDALRSAGFRVATDSHPCPPLQRPGGSGRSVC